MEGETTRDSGAHADKDDFLLGEGTAHHLLASEIVGG